MATDSSRRTSRQLRGDLSLINNTPFPAALIALTRSVAKPTLIVKGTYTIRPNARPLRAAKLLPLTAVDVPAVPGEHATAAARYETDFVPFKPRADCLCIGSAHPPGGGAQSCVVSFGVGQHFDKQILVIGNRHWVRHGEQHVVATEPATFKSMPLTFANAYGGQDLSANDASAFFAPNPSGKGYGVTAQAVVGRPLPNLEDPLHRLQSWNDRVAPTAFGPVGRTWQPRLGRAGTFDETWLRERAPLMPVDFSYRYYNAAPDDQQVKRYLRGDEEVRLTNMHPTHPSLRFTLPGVRLRAIIASAASDKGAPEISLREVAVNLDTLWVDADALQMLLVWRAPIRRELADARMLIVGERVDAPATPAEIFRPILAGLDAREAEAARREAGLDREEVAEEVPETTEDEVDTGEA